MRMRRLPPAAPPVAELLRRARSRRPDEPHHQRHRDDPAGVQLRPGQRAQRLAAAGLDRLSTCSRLSLPFALLSLAVVPVMVVATLWFSGQARKAFRRTRQEMGSVNAELQESIAAVREVQAFNRADENIENFRAGQRRQPRRQRPRGGFHQRPGAHPGSAGLPGAGDRGRAWAAWPCSATSRCSARPSRSAW